MNSPIDDGGYYSPVSPTSKKRSTRACDQCRKTKSRCDLPTGGGKCSNCDAASIDCTVSGPSRKRGPAKGYLHSIETRLHETEALLGVMLMSSDTRIRSFLRDLMNTDQQARDILTRVNESSYGPLGREHDREEAETENLSHRPKGNITMRCAINEWQDKLLALLTSLRQNHPHMNQTPSTSRAESDLSAEHSIKSEHINAPPPQLEISTTRSHMSEGEVTLDDRNQIHYYGSASGLNLLNKIPRDDNSNAGGIWRLPETEYQVIQALPSELVMPPLETQQHLLDIFFTYVYPSYPIVDKYQFLSKFRTMSQDQHMLPHPDPFKILLFSIFSLASRLFPHNCDISQSSQEASEGYFAQAKALIDRTYHLSHPTICQSLLLLGIREVGMGATAQAWLYFGMAIRMAQDLGMHRSVEKWSLQGRSLLSNDQIVLRQRIWYGCVKADRYFSMFLGRPMTIRDCDFDAYMPSPMTSEEMAIWDHHPQLTIHGLYTAIPGRFISCFNANVSLSVIVGYVLEKLYPVRGTFVIKDAIDLRRQLKHWLDNLPQHLQLYTYDAFTKVPPHLLNLHAEYCAAVILVNRPLLRVIDPTESPEIVSMVSDAWDQSITAAQTIGDIMRAWRRNFPIRSAFPFLIFDIFHAGMVWIAALTMRALNPIYLENLELCLETLKEIQETYPLAGRCHQLLIGAKIPRVGDQQSSKQPSKMISPPESYSRGQNQSNTYGEPYTYSNHDPQALAYVNQLLSSGIPQASTHPNFVNGFHWSPGVELPSFDYGSGVGETHPTLTGSPVPFTAGHRGQGEEVSQAGMASKSNTPYKYHSQS